MVTETFLLCLALVESGCKDVPAYTGPAAGYHQHKPISIDEANRILEAKGFGPAFYCLDDRHDYWMSRSAACVILQHWRPILERRYSCQWTADDALAFWHYGPKNWRPDSKDKPEDRERSRQYRVFLEAVRKSGGFRAYLAGLGIQ